MSPYRARPIVLQTVSLTAAVMINYWTVILE